MAMPPGGTMPPEGMMGPPSGMPPIIPQAGRQMSRLEAETKLRAIKRRKARDDQEIELEKGKNESNRRQLLIQLFSKLRQVGVDPSDPQSIAAFIEYLRENDPDMLEFFETAMNALLPDEAASAEAGIAPPMGTPSQGMGEVELPPEMGEDMEESESVGNFKEAPESPTF